jgi:hypothetical protein
MDPDERAAGISSSSSEGPDAQIARLNLRSHGTVAEQHAIGEKVGKMRHVNPKGSRGSRASAVPPPAAAKYTGVTGKPLPVL